MADLENLIRSALAGRYQVEERIGTGATAEVFRAHDRKLGRDVAVKVLRPQVALMLGPERFLREIRLAASLQHPHILPIYDSGQTDGLLYYVTPVVTGSSLREHIERSGPLPFDEAVRIAREVASALDYAHSRGVIHRDIKPGNILLTEGGALVADFGVAQPIAQDPDTRLTASGLVVGTPAYMSPEQAFGSGDVGPASDLYALGCVVYEMLAARLPFEASTPGSMAALHASGQAPPLRAIRKDVSVAVDRAVLRAMAKDPARRFRTAAAFGEALTARRGLSERIGGLVRAARAGRVPRAIAVYVVVSLLLVLATDWAVNRYLLSYHLTRFVMLALLLLVPAVATTWYFRARLRRAAAPVGLNFSAATVILALLFAGKDLGSTLTARDVVTETGSLETRLVPKPAFRRRVAMFPFVPDSAAADEAGGRTDVGGTDVGDVGWLAYGIPLVLEQKLLQDPFFDVRSSFRDDLRRAGIPDGARPPELLQDRIARQNGLDYVLTGSYSVSDAGVSARIELRDVARGRVLATFSPGPSSLTTLSDAAAARVQDLLHVRGGIPGQVRDLSTADLLSGSPEALRAWVRGTERTEVYGDYEGAVPLLSEAVALDSGFAVASAHLFGAFVATNRLDEAGPAAENALAHEYRLTERHALNLKQGYWIIVRKNWQRAALLAKRKVGLFPDDVEARERLAAIHLRYADTAAAAAQYDTVLQQDPRSRVAVDGLAAIRRAEGRLDDAVTLYELYFERVPDDLDARLGIGDMYMASGHLDRARETFETLQLELPRDPRLPLRLGTVALRQGEIDRAADLYDAALARSTVQEDSLAALQAVLELELQRGRLNAAAARVSEIRAASAGAGHPLRQRLTALGTVAKLARAGRAAHGRALLDSLGAGLRPPLLVFLEEARVRFYLVAGPPDSLASSLNRLAIEAEAVGPSEWQALLEFGWAEHDRQAGDCVGALERYERALAAGPADPGPLYRSYAECLYRAGRSAEAVSMLERALRWSASDAVAHLALSRLLLELGDSAGARSHVDESLRIWAAADPAFAPAREALALRLSLGEGPR